MKIKIVTIDMSDKDISCAVSSITDSILDKVIKPDTDKQDKSGINSPDIDEIFKSFMDMNKSDTGSDKPIDKPVNEPVSKPDKKKRKKHYNTTEGQRILKEEILSNILTVLTDKQYADKWISSSIIMDELGLKGKSKKKKQIKQVLYNTLNSLTNTGSIKYKSIDNETKLSDTYMIGRSNKAISANGSLRLYQIA